MSTLTSTSCFRRGNALTMTIDTLNNDRWTRGIFSFHFIFSLRHIFDNVHDLCTVIILLACCRQNVHPTHGLTFEQAFPSLWLHCSCVPGRRLMPFKSYLLASSDGNIILGHRLRGRRAQQALILVQSLDRAWHLLRRWLLVLLFHGMRRASVLGDLIVVLVTTHRIVRV